MNAPTPLTPCPRCGRHYKSTDDSCPFCGSNPVPGKVMRTFAAGLSAVMLMACYGAPPGDYVGDTGDDTGAATDIDADGFTVAQGDCDDGDAAVNPDALEDCTDTIDNDCDGKIDGDDEDCMTD